MAQALSDSIPDTPPRNITARVLAPLALMVCLLALFLLVSGTLSGGEDGAGDPGERERTGQRQNRPELSGSTYVVQPGDTLSQIAARAGIPLERLQRRNPDLDLQTLNTGQQIKLR